MTTTPLWVPLVVTGIGVLGTLTAGIASGLITQRWANEREDKAWARERERERDRWAREDEARTFELRREVLEGFYQAVKALARRAYDHGYGFDNTPELPFDWHADAFAKLTRLGLYVDRRVYAAAETAYDAACSWGQHTKYDDPDDPEFMHVSSGSTMLSTSCSFSCVRPSRYRRAIYLCLSRATPTRLKRLLSARLSHDGAAWAMVIRPPSRASRSSTAWSRSFWLNSGLPHLDRGTHGRLGARPRGGCPAHRHAPGWSCRVAARTRRFPR